MKNGFLNVMVKLFGYAAAPLSKAMAAKGASVVVAGEGFFVNGSEGPLRQGELERASKWAAGLNQIRA